MRVNRKGITIAVLCIVFALASAAVPAGALSLPSTPTSPDAPQTFFPQNMYSKDMASSMPQIGMSPGAADKPASTIAPSPDYSFLAQALGMVPAGDDQTKSQMTAIKAMQAGYQPRYGTARTSPSWMDQFTEPASIDGVGNPAESAYAAFIKGQPNMTNIFMN